MSDSNRPSMSALRAGLATIPLLQGLDAARQSELADAAIWREYAPGAVVLLEGEGPSGLNYLQYGWLKAVKQSPDGREQILRLIGPSEIFNEVGVFANMTNPATVIALEAAGAWLLPRAQLHDILRTHPDVAEKVIENMAQRILYLVSMIADLSLRTVEVRVAHFLLEEAKDDQLHRQRWATQAELAARLGTVSDVISRVFRNLSDAGIIQVNHHEIRIVDRPALEAIAQIVQ